MAVPRGVSASRAQRGSTIVLYRFDPKCRTKEDGRFEELRAEVKMHCVCVPEPPDKKRTIWVETQILSSPTLSSYVLASVQDPRSSYACMCLSPFVLFFAEI